MRQFIATARSADAAGAARLPMSISRMSPAGDRGQAADEGRSAADCLNSAQRDIPFTGLRITGKAQSA
jgi:hypothetical protein